VKKLESSIFLWLFQKLSSLPPWMEIPMKIGLAFSFLFTFMSYDSFSENHSGSIAELCGKLFLFVLFTFLCGFVIGLPVVLFIYIIKKIPFFDSWRRGWVKIFRRKK